MKVFTRQVRRYVGVSAASVICTLFIVTNWYIDTDSAVRRAVKAHQPDPSPHQPLPTASTNMVTERARDWRRTNRVVLEYNPDVARRLKKLAEHQTPADHPDTVRLARDLMDPPRDNADGIKHSRYIMKTPQAEKVDNITNKTVCIHVIYFQLACCS